MKVLIVAILVAWLSTAQILAFGQASVEIKPAPVSNKVIGTGRISGKVVKDSKQPFDLATVALFKVSDSNLLKSTFTAEDGKFSFEQLTEGSYQLRISAMGYQNLQSAVILLKAGASSILLPDLTLRATTKDLKEVAITGKKAFIERKIDRTVVNVDALIANSGTTAMDVLEKSPGVIVDQNGAISLKGKQGVAIFIDGKPSYLSGTDLENYLRSLPSSALDQIELMTNPPAKYDAAGNGGVINIKTHKNDQRGWNGGLNLGYVQGQLARTNNSFNMNYRKNKLNFFTNLGYSHQNNFTDLDLFRRYKNEDGSTQSFFEQNSYIRRKGNMLNGKIGMDYYQSEKSTWGLVLTGMDRSGNQTTDNVSQLLNAGRELDSVVKALSKDRQSFKNLGVNLNYRHDFDKSGQQLALDADYLVYKTNTRQQILNSSYLPDQSLKSEDILHGELPANIKIYSFKADYTKPFKNNWKVDAGVKSSYTKTDNVGAYSYTIGEVTKPDYQKSNHFIYKENINSGYLNLSRESGKWSIQLGLRAENTNSDGHQLGNPVKPDSAFNRNYTSLFPTAYVSYKLDTLGNHQIGLNYGRRVDRPYFQDLNPFVSPLDKFTYYEGNPFLNPSFTNSIELSHTYKNKITTTLSYSDTKDEVNETIEIRDGIYYSRPGNIGRKVVKSLSVNAGLDLFSWLTWQFYGEVTNIDAKSADFYSGALHTKGTFFSTNNSFQFKLSESWTAEGSGSYRSKITDVQFTIGRMYGFNAGVQKKLSPSSTIRINGNDLFYTRITNGKINNLAGTTAGWRNRADSRNVVLSYSYRFGKTFSGVRKHKNTGAEDEQNRVKN
ncbi:TonB-dependent receptor [Pedobacter gandavensis]|uniref:Outer membrane beta-barrel protein n=1 Tax=Pedobacter gandavensis TaxID=2679963 RepID=A0ABR6EYU3_9SPHI|nr:TonB-dependent receptor [Pedobacter gandavensis]MBB2150437.1 outer membrane beta-barrel protein [Pedobacter gandavensis]